MTANKPVRRPAPVKARKPSTAAAKTATKTSPKTAAPPAKPARSVPRPARAVFTPLAAGQIWQLGEANLKVEMVGKLLLHYKLAKPNAVRTPTSIAGISTLVKYMKKNKAVLISG
jgi:hypothetical protein